MKMKMNRQTKLSAWISSAVTYYGKSEVAPTLYQAWCLEGRWETGDIAVCI